MNGVLFIFNFCAALCGRMVGMLQYLSNTDILIINDRYLHANKLALLGDSIDMVHGTAQPSLIFSLLDDDHYLLLYKTPLILLTVDEPISFFSFPLKRSNFLGSLQESGHQR